MAAGIILVREAGGYAFDCDGGDDMLASGNIVAGNETVSKELLRGAQGGESLTHRSRQAALSLTAIST